MEYDIEIDKITDAWVLERKRYPGDNDNNNLINGDANSDKNDDDDINIINNDMMTMIMERKF